MLRLLHTADLHLDSRFPALGEKEEERRLDLVRAFEKIVGLAIREEVHLALFCGDLFDLADPDPEIVATVRAGFASLKERGIVAVILPGTHDPYLPQESIYRRDTFDAVVLTEPIVTEPKKIYVRGSEVWLYGFAWQGGRADELLASLQRRPGPGLHIGLLHGSRRGSPEWDYRHKDIPFSVDELAALNLDYVALGHYHSFETLSSATGRLFACYPGSPEGKRFSEEGDRYCALVEIAPPQVKITRVKTNRRTLKSAALDLTGIDSADAALARITPLADPDLIFRLRLTGTVEFPLAIDRLQERLQEHFFHLELIDATRLFDSAYARRIEDEPTIRGLFVRRARQMLASAPEKERPIVEAAFREVLARFSAGERETR